VVEKASIDEAYLLVSLQQLAAKVGLAKCHTYPLIVYT
jgi:hypothetical protein